MQQIDGMKVVFRADASVDMGTGHVMRCLVLADEIARSGARSTFVCRAHPGALTDLIRERGHPVHVLPLRNGRDGPGPEGTAHAAWLGTDQRTDAEETIRALSGSHVHRLVVDHYGLDATWERLLGPHVDRIMVIDDLADRPHAADLLLDQNLGDKASLYGPLVGPGCGLLLGPQYALLAPAFRSGRNASLARRHGRSSTHLLVTLGGVDKDNVTGWVLEQLKHLQTHVPLRMSVVMGRTAPWVDAVRELASNMPWPTEVLVDVKDMAALMADADLAVGAAGSTSWERCCMGLPSVLMILAENQRPIARALSAAGAVSTVDHTRPDAGATLHQALVALITNTSHKDAMSTAAASITDGEGAERVGRALLALGTNS